MSTVSAWRSFVIIRISISIAAMAAAVCCTTNQAAAETPLAAEAVGQGPTRAPTPTASETGAEHVALSLPEAIRRAMAQAPEVVAAQNNIRQAEARRVGAGVIMPVNPRLSVDARPTLYK